MADQLLANLEFPSQAGNERLAMDGVTAALNAAGITLPARRLERLQTAVSEATLNAMEHGNGYRASCPTRVKVRASDAEICVTVIDQGGPRPVSVETPSLDAKLAGQQSPRGWGLFLIEHMVDQVNDECDGAEHSVHLRVHRSDD